MPMAMIPKMKTGIVLFAASLLLVGCAHTICLKIVDSSNNQPLAGARIVWRQDSAYNMLTGKRHSAGPTNLVSNESGVVVVKGIHKKWASRFIFSHPGYGTLYGTYWPQHLNLAKNIMSAPLPQDTFILEEPPTIQESTNGCFIVPLQR
jgi:hypothetical protein